MSENFLGPKSGHKRQCAPPESFQPPHPKPPGRRRPTKSDTPSLKVPKIPFKTRLRDPWRYFPSFSLAFPADAPADALRIQMGRRSISHHFPPPQSALFTRLSHSLQASSCLDRPPPPVYGVSCTRIVYGVSATEIPSPFPYNSFLPRKLCTQSLYACPLHGPTS